MTKLLVMLSVLTAMETTVQTGKSRILLTANDAQKRVDVTVDGQPFTSYIYPGPSVLKKAVLYPIRSAGGHFITRGWPMAPRPGERVDHPHHVGLWLNYGDVNGHDFWNNSTDGMANNNRTAPAPRYGTIVHTGIKSMKSGDDQADLVVTADWLGQDGVSMLREKTTYVFRGRGNARSIDRITTLTAVGKDAVFTDNKEGLIGLRLARELEHPSTKAEVFTDASGVATNVPVVNNTGVTGQYSSSKGIVGDAVWGTRGKWVNLSGTVAGEALTVTLFDHPQNVGYPTYWHARGYGLFAANPLAPSVFSGGKAPAMNYTLPAGKSVTFRYRLVITSGSLATGQTALQARQFDSEKQ